MLMSKNVNNDVSKDLPIGHNRQGILFSVTNQPLPPKKKKTKNKNKDGCGMLCNVSSVKSTFTGTEGSTYVRRTPVFIGRGGVSQKT